MFLAAKQGQKPVPQQNKIRQQKVKDQKGMTLLEIIIVLGIIGTIIVLALGPCTVYANPTSKSEEGNDASIEQKNIIDLMQRNLKFESEKLNIENQITLAKLKKELKEINNLISEEYFVDKSDNTVEDQNNDEFDKHINEIMDSPIRPAVKPKVIMVSHIAGVRRFGVSDSNDSIILVAENSFFRVNGTRYRVVLKNNQYIVVE